MKECGREKYIYIDKEIDRYIDKEKREIEKNVYAT